MKKGTVSWILSALVAILVPCKGVSEIEDGSVSSGLGNGNASSHYYLASLSPSKEINGGCQETVKIAGNGIKDEILVDCNTKRYVITNHDQLVVGETIYSAAPRNQEPSTLVIIKDGACEQRTYKDGVYSSSSVLSSQECDNIKQAMTKVTGEWRQHGGSEEHNANYNNNYNNNAGGDQGSSGGWDQENAGGWGDWGKGNNKGWGGWGQGNVGGWDQDNTNDWDQGSAGYWGGWGQGNWKNYDYGNYE